MVLTISTISPAGSGVNVNIGKKLFFDKSPLRLTFQDIFSFYDVLIIVILTIEILDNTDSEIMNNNAANS